MKNKLKHIVLIACVMVLAIVAAGCSESTMIDDYRAKGYRIFVTYDCNGGKMTGRSNASIVDAYKPDSFTADGNGTVTIQLTSPTDPSRRPAGAEKVTVARNGYFYTGWYASREVKLVDGKPVNDDGVELVERDGKYIIASTADEKTPTASEPAYIYSNPWDFESDRLTYNASEGKYKEITLYAGWVKNYEFRYFFEAVDEDGNVVTDDDGNIVWEEHKDFTAFDYKAVTADGSTKADQNTIWIPVVSNGAMSYNHHKYADGSTFKFPVQDGRTFVGAYKDAACTQPITETYTHTGTYNHETATATNRVQNVYVKTVKGVKYWISTPDQLYDNADINGEYEIQNDLDFTGKTWPATISTGIFRGKMYGKNGAKVTISNVTVTHNSSSATIGGLFGAIGAGAEISNVAFNNVTVDYKSTGSRLRNATFGLFAGQVDDTAVFTNVSFSGMMKIGAISLASPYRINVFANDGEEALANVQKGTIRLQIYGTKKTETAYEYMVSNPSEVTVVDGLVQLSFAAAKRYDQPYYEINLG